MIRCARFTKQESSNWSLFYWKNYEDHFFLLLYQERQKILSGQDTDIASGFESDSVTGHMCLF